MKNLRLMSATALLLLNACTNASVLNDIKKQNDQDVQAQAQEDPSLYVLSARVALSYDQAKSGTYTASWEDGEGTVEIGNENRSTFLQRTSTTGLSGEGYSFNFTFNGTNYSSDKLSLSECDALGKSLGYEAGTFRRMETAYNFGFESGPADEVAIPEYVPPAPGLASQINPGLAPQIKLLRAQLGASGQDAKAVTCRTAMPGGKRLLRVSVQGKISEAWRLFREDKTVIAAGSLTLESDPIERVKQTFFFSFDRSSDVETNQLPILIQTPQGEKSFTVSFDACTSLDKSGYGDPSRINKLISEDISIFVNDKGEVQESASRTCCYSDGTCSILTP